MPGISFGKGLTIATTHSQGRAACKRIDEQKYFIIAHYLNH
jgi:hypothetical protein